MENIEEIPTEFFKHIEEITTEFFKRRFPEKNIAFEKKCGYFQEWRERFSLPHPEVYMDKMSKIVWEQMKKDFIK